MKNINNFLDMSIKTLIEALLKFAPKVATFQKGVTLGKYISLKLVSIKLNTPKGFSRCYFWGMKLVNTKYKKGTAMPS